MSSAQKIIYNHSKKKRSAAQTQFKKKNVVIIISAPTLFIQSSNDVVDVVRKESSAVQDGGQHGCNGSAGHRLVVRVFVHLKGEKALEQLCFSKTMLTESPEVGVDDSLLYYPSCNVKSFCTSPLVWHQLFLSESGSRHGNHCSQLQLCQSCKRRTFWSIYYLSGSFIPRKQQLIFGTKKKKCTHY